VTPLAHAARALLGAWDALRAHRASLPRGGYGALADRSLRERELERAHDAALGALRAASDDEGSEGGEHG
jgi:hypothetical protein